MMSAGGLLEPILDEIADRVVARLLKAQARMIDQTKSELGPRRHREAVKRRIARGEGGAAIVGRKHLLTPEALQEELARLARPANEDRPAGAAHEATAKPRARELAEFERELLAQLREM